MESKAVLKNVGLSPKKTRIPAVIVSGMKVTEALIALKFMEKGTAVHVAKVIKSAAANAQQKGAAIADLFISEIRVDKGGSRVKHYHPKAKGGGYAVWQRGKSHITVIVKDNNDKVTKESKKVKKVEEVKVENSENTKVKKVAKKTSTAKAKKTVESK